jgi:Mn-dependent DtxR family transcriptional regulator
MRKSSPPPSKSAERVIQYLEIIEKATNDKGFAKRYDIFKKAMNNAYADYVIKYLKNSGWVQGDDEKGYTLSKIGKDFLDLSRKRRDLIGQLTRELSGDKIRPYF